MSLYKHYVWERLGDYTIETEQGFATYRFLNEKKTVYIVDIYVLPEFRKSGLAADMANEIAEIAKKEGATEMLGTVSPSANTATDSMKVLLAYGMKLLNASEQLIVFRKDI